MAKMTIASKTLKAKTTWRVPAKVRSQISSALIIDKEGANQNSSTERISTPEAEKRMTE